jgi:hypothetical protein
MRFSAHTASATDRVKATESLFVKAFKSLLQQNRPAGDVY